MSFSTVTLSEIAKPVVRPIAVVPGTSYRTIGVKWWGEGAYERETIDGTQTAANTLSIVREDDLIINKIWVRHGSTAIATKVVDGCAASGEFPTFELDNSRILPRWMHWLTKNRDFWQKCDNLSRGTSGKNRIRPELFLVIEIPLPPLEEQQRIVARIEGLAAKVEKAKGLQKEAIEEAQSLFASTMNSIWHNQNGWNAKPIRDLVTIVSGLVDPRDEPYASLPHINGEAMESGTGKLLSYRIAKDDGLISGKFHFNAGAILYSKIRPYLRKAVQVPVEGICSADVYAFESIGPCL
jgi:restriction endonuclease S subunit